jgi:hypothetical protein
MSKYARLIRDLWSDGYKVFGTIAPLASLSFTLAKALEVHVSLRDISYAWAFAPLLAWLFVAYLRRWLAYRDLEAQLDTRNKKMAVKAAIGRYIDAGNKLLISSSTGSGNSSMKKSAEQWVTNAHDFINAAFGSGEVTLFLSDAGYTFYSSNGMVGNLIKGRIRRLNELLIRVHSLDIDKDFDPVSWLIQSSQSQSRA